MHSLVWLSTNLISLSLSLYRTKDLTYSWAQQPIKRQIQRKMVSEWVRVDEQSEENTKKDMGREVGIAASQGGSWSNSQRKAPVVFVWLLLSSNIHPLNFHPLLTVFIRITQYSSIQCVLRGLHLSTSIELLDVKTYPFTTPNSAWCSWFLI